MLLIGFPLITMYYLTTGNDYGRKNYESAKPKGDFKDLCNTIDLEEGRTYLLVPTIQKSNAEVNSSLNNLMSDLSEEPLFEVKFIDDSNYQNQQGDELQSETGTCDLKSTNMVLVDNQGRIRNKYDFQKSDFAHLMEDLPFVLPRKIKRDIVEKNYETQ